MGFLICLKNNKAVFVSGKKEIRGRPRDLAFLDTEMETVVKKSELSVNMEP
ncbi:hypothetical protein ACIQY5_20160 [Peribacillus frigoritolerans]|uniref:hypothetical protein n=1 Tax=Peribacillus frigoritolerans TaxID=450367 RepID=UPI003803263B